MRMEGQAMKFELTVADADLEAGVRYLALIAEAHVQMGAIDRLTAMTIGAARAAGWKPESEKRKRREK